MVGREGAVAGRQRRAARVGPLLGVQLHRESQPGRGGEEPVHLGRREGDRLAVGVDGVGQPSRGRRRQDLADDQIEPGVRAPLELGRHGVGAEEGGPDRDRQQLAEPPGHAQLAELGVAVEPVAALHLHGGDAVGEQRRQPGPALAQQRRLVGGAGGGHGGADAAAGPGQLLVAGPVQPPLELLGAVAGVDQVGVAVDQAGGEQPPLGVELERAPWRRPAARRPGRRRRSGRPAPPARRRGGSPYGEPGEPWSPAGPAGSAGPSRRPARSPPGRPPAWAGRARPGARSPRPAGSRRRRGASRRWPGRSRARGPGGGPPPRCRRPRSPPRRAARSPCRRRRRGGSRPRWRRRRC